METTKEQLLLMMKQYEIGKKPLAKLMGWGETTVMRYMDGMEPNREFAERIAHLAHHPKEYLTLLEQNKENISTVAYEKTKEAAYRCIFCDRSTEAMQFVINRAGGDIAPFQVIATLFYAQILSLIDYGTPIFEEEVSVEAKAMLPYPELYESLLKEGIRVLAPQKSTLNSHDEACLTEIYQTLNGYSSNAIHAVLKRDKRRLRRGKVSNVAQLHIAGDTLREQYEQTLLKMGMDPTHFDLRQYFTNCLREK